MRKNLLDLSGKIDPIKIEFFEIISNVAKAANIHFFVVGATARGMILEEGFDIPRKRATEDIDLGIQVSGWKQYQTLKAVLTKTKKFQLAREPHRLIFNEVIPIDIIPFGTIANPDSSIVWPPENETTMSTLGFGESYQHSLTVRLRSNPILDVQFASLGGIVLLKLISWNENYARRDKDAKDILLIMQNYLDAGNQDSLYNEEIDLVEVENFDYVLAGARLLGRDVAKICHHATAKKVLEILDRETGEQKNYKLVADMREGFSGEEFEEKLQLLEAFKLGVQDKAG